MGFPVRLTEFPRTKATSTKSEYPILVPDEAMPPHDNVFRPSNNRQSHQRPPKSIMAT